MTAKSNKVKVTKEQKEILLGILLGDSHMELAPNRKSARLKIEQQSKKMEYVEHLHTVFKDWLPGNIVPATNSNNLKFSTRYSATLLFYHTEFYKAEGRQVPRWIEHAFTPRSLAYLIMDDGGIKSKDSKGMYLNLYGLSKRNQEALCCVLRTKRFGLKVKVAKDRKFFRIFISGHSYDTLMRLIDPYILPCVRYKIPPPLHQNLVYQIRSL